MGAKQLLELGKPGEIVTYYWGEQPAYDKYCRRVEGDRVPVKSGQYFVAYYVSELRRMRAEIMSIVDQTFVDEDEAVSEHHQLSLVL